MEEDEDGEALKKKKYNSQTQAALNIASGSHVFVSAAFPLGPSSQELLRPEIWCLDHQLSRRYLRVETTHQAWQVQSLRVPGRLATGFCREKPDPLWNRLRLSGHLCPKGPRGYQRETNID